MPDLDVPAEHIEDLVPAVLLRDEVLDVPEMSLLEGVRLYVILSRRLHAVYVCFYPLGAGTMMYNP